MMSSWVRIIALSHWALSDLLIAPSLSSAHPELQPCWGNVFEALLLYLCYFLGLNCSVYVALSLEWGLWGLTGGERSYKKGSRLLYCYYLWIKSSSVVLLFLPLTQDLVMWLAWTNRSSTSTKQEEALKKLVALKIAFVTHLPCMKLTLVLEHKKFFSRQESWEVANHCFKPLSLGGDLSCKVQKMGVI
jgi:hypothetical protein